MERKVKVAHFGVGRMGCKIISDLLDKQGELVAAFDANPALIGKDVGEVLGIDPIGVPIQAFDSACKVLETLRPDIATISTQGTLAEMEDILTLCCRAGCNAVTIGENAAWPWTTEAEIAKKLDSLAKECGVTISAGGYPDTFWQTLVLVLAGAQEKITRIHGTVTYNVEQYGPHFIVGHGVGLAQAEFHAKYARESERGDHGFGIHCMPGDPNGWLANALGLTIISQVMKIVPRLSDKPVWCETYQRDILPGEVLGEANLVHTETAEGITIDLEICGKIYAPDETDSLTWKIEGKPGITVIIPAPDTAEFTATSPVNRIPQVIAARPGYVTTNELPIARYIVRSLNDYVN